ncbi:MAG: Fur family transcriptional regulator [bacterium]
MDDKLVFRDKIISELDRLGYRKSSKRNAIISAFVTSDKHLNADELYDIVKKNHKGIGFVTVYRTLKLLARCGFAREVDFKDGFTRYEINDEPSVQHDHLVCIKCGAVIEFEDSEIKGLKDRASKQAGFKPIFHRLEIFGICKKCQDKGKIKDQAYKH